jgi:hypothetical protein
MAETCNLLTMWRPDHKETPEECARQALVLFAELARIDPSFEVFRTTSRRRGKYVDTPVPTDVQGLAGLFAKGVIRGQFSRKPIETLGYRLHAQTPSRRYGSETSYSSIAINGGTSGANANSCLLNLYVEADDYERVVNVPMQIQLFHAMVKAFSPQVGHADIGDFRDAVVDIPSHLRTELAVDWIMYFSRGWGTVPPLPAPVRIEPVGRVGTLVILTPERASASNPEDVRLGRQVQALLSKAGLLNLDRLDGGAQRTRN